MDPQPLLSFQHVLGEAVAEIINAALAVEPPGACPPRWSAVLAHYSASPLDEQERFDEIRREKQNKGAPLSEVQACLQGLALQIHQQLKQHRPDADTGAFEQALEQMVQEGVAHYRSLACQRPAGMFAHALATAKRKQFVGLKPGAYVLLCPSCGGPRLNPEQLVCSYCKGTFHESTNT